MDVILACILLLSELGIVELLTICRVVFAKLSKLVELVPVTDSDVMLALILLESG